MILTDERVEERAAALWRFERLGGRPGRLVALDRLVRAGRRTDWPGRAKGPEARVGPACTECANLGCSLCWTWTPEEPAR